MSCGRCELRHRPEQLCEGGCCSAPRCRAATPTYANVPAAQVLALPEAMNLRDAAMTEPAACAVHAVELSGAVPGASAWWWRGPDRAVPLRSSACRGRQRYVSGPNPDRLAMAVAMGWTATSAMSSKRPRRWPGHRGGGVDLRLERSAWPDSANLLASTVSGGQVLARRAGARMLTDCR